MFMLGVTQAKKLRQLSEAFERQARKFGKTIIKELHLPYEAKTIPPESKMGIAGGEKYIVVRPRRELHP